VPLFVRVPGVKPARVADPVSGIDIGATLLDLVGADTPGTFLGQSLVPYLRGERPKLTRPIASDMGSVQSVVFGKYKVIDDSRRNMVEVYDLSVDARERENLYGTLDGHDELMLKALRRFFDVRRTKAPRRRSSETE
jgi:arylsulfatase A-like enzyme